MKKIIVIYVIISTTNNYKIIRFSIVLHYVKYINCFWIVLVVLISRKPIKWKNPLVSDLYSAVIY